MLERDKFKLLTMGANPREITEITPSDLEEIARGWSETPEQDRGVVIFYSPFEFVVGTPYQRVNYFGRTGNRISLRLVKSEDDKFIRLEPFTNIYFGPNSMLRRDVPSSSQVDISLSHNPSVELYSDSISDEDWKNEAKRERYETMGKRLRPVLGRFATGYSIVISDKESIRSAISWDTIGFGKTYLVHYLAKPENAGLEWYFGNIWKYIADNAGLSLEQDNEIVPTIYEKPIRGPPIYSPATKSLRAYDEKSKVTYNFGSIGLMLLLKMTFSKPKSRESLERQLLEAEDISPEDIHHSYLGVPDKSTEYTFSIVPENAYKIPEFIKAMRVKRRSQKKT